MANILLVFDSSVANQLISAAIIMGKYPQATSIDTAGLNTAGITTLINAVPATSQARVLVCAVVDAAPALGQLTPAQITALDGKLDGEPGSDTASTVYAQSTGFPWNQKNQPKIVWDALFPLQSNPFVVVALGNNKFKTELAASIATAGSVTSLTDGVATFSVDSLAGLYIEITAGTGAGQVRKIRTNSATVITPTENFGIAPDATSEYIIYAYQISEQALVAAATASAGGAATITDAGAGWAVNAFAGKQVQLVSGLGAGQVGTIVSNTADTLTINVPWTTAPDNTTVFDIYSYTFNNLNTETIFYSGTATAGGANTLTDTTQAFVVNQLTGAYVKIISGTGAGQVRVIASNTATAVTTIQNWAVNPDATSVYQIYNFAAPWNFELADQQFTLAIQILYNDLAIASVKEVVRDLLNFKGAIRQGDIVTNQSKADAAQKLVLSQGAVIRAAYTSLGLA